MFLVFNPWSLFHSAAMASLRRLCNECCRCFGFGALSRSWLPNLWRVIMTWWWSPGEIDTLDWPQDPRDSSLLYRTSGISTLWVNHKTTWALHLDHNCARYQSWRFSHTCSSPRNVGVKRKFIFKANEPKFGVSNLSHRQYLFPTFISQQIYPTFVWSVNSGCQGIISGEAIKILVCLGGL